MNLTIRGRLLVLNVLGVLLLLAVFLVGDYGISEMGAGTQRLATAGVAMRNHLECDMMHDALRSDVLAAILADNENDRRTVQGDYKEHSEWFHRCLNENKSLDLDDSIKSALRGVEPLLDAYEKSAGRIIERAATDVNAAKAELPAFYESFTQLEGAMEDASDKISVVTENAENEARSIESSAHRSAITLGLTAVITLTLVAFWIVRSITRPLSDIIVRFKDIAEGEGDLTKRLNISGRDEVAELSRWFDLFMENLHGIMVQLRATAELVGSAASTCSTGITEISDGARSQAAALEETAATVTEINGTTQQSAQNSQTANQLASGARDVAEKGGAVVMSAIDAMNEINRSARRIAEIIGTIDEIAFQTNLLALNAAVEAARAGEQGRGFAVVASEVRNLALRSATAAKEIKSLIQESVQKVEKGSLVVNQSGKTFEDIVSSVKRVTDIVGEIAAATREQATGIDQLSRAISQMDQVTQGNSRRTQEISDTSATLADHGSQLTNLVSRFKLADSLAKAPMVRPVKVKTERPSEWMRGEKSKSSAAPSPAGERETTPVKSGQDDEWEF